MAHPALDPGASWAGGRRRARRVGRGPLGGLVVLNAGLAAAAAWAWAGPTAAGQAGLPARPRGQYALVGGQTRTGDSNAVYVLDSTNHEMIVLRWNDSQRKMDGLGYRDLNSDARSDGGRR